MWKGAVILLAFILIQTVIYKNLETSIQKTKYIIATIQRFLQVSRAMKRIDILRKKKKDLSRLMISLRSCFKLRYRKRGGKRYSKSAEGTGSLFERSCGQYEGLESGQSYLYQTPYTKNFRDGKLQ